MFTFRRLQQNILPRGLYQEDQGIFGFAISCCQVICKLPQLTVTSTTKELHSLPAQCVAWVGQSTAISVQGSEAQKFANTGEN